MKKTGVTLIELVITVMLISILGALGFIQYGNYREEALGKEARANLRLIVAAQRIYKIKTSAYFPVAGGTESDVASINDNLKVMLSTVGGPSRVWDYLVDSSAGNTCVQASRVGGPAKTWSFRNNDPDGDPDQDGTCP
ncbi:MAG: type II secretion system protein [Candidatus Omnitrophota bacterium]